MTRTMAMASCALAVFAAASCETLETIAEQALSIDPRADALIREMSEWITGADHFTFQVIDQMEDIMENGDKQVFGRHISATVSGPNKLRVDVTGDLSDRSFWKDERTLTILDTESNVYGRVSAPGSIDEMMDRILEEYEISMPIADLISSDVYTILTQDVLTSRYVGRENLDGLDCHHLAFTQENIDWEAWIDAGDAPLMRQWMIRYKNLPGQPKYIAWLEGYDILTEIAPRTFAFQRPPNAKEVRGLPLAKVRAGGVGADGRSTISSSRASRPANIRHPISPQVQGGYYGSIRQSSTDHRRARATRRLIVKP